jgi:hypothetical protein
MTYLETFRTYLKKFKPRGSQATGCCPFHEDRIPSFSVNLETGQWFCHGCQEKGNELTFLLKLGVPMQKKESELKEVKTYDYFDEKGELLYQTVRYEPKTFRQRRPDGAGGWIWNLDGVRRVIYNLPKVLDAIRKGKVVAIAEGEKDADTLTSLGIVGTCSPMGAGKWPDEFSQYFRDADVFVFYDNDPPGHEHRDDEIRSLQGIPRRLQVIHQHDHFKDITDWRENGFKTRENFLTLIREQVVTADKTINERMNLMKEKTREFTAALSHLAPQGINSLKGKSLVGVQEIWRLMDRYDETAIGWVVEESNEPWNESFPGKLSQDILQRLQELLSNE